MSDLELALRQTLDDVADLVPVSPTALADHRQRLAPARRSRRTLSLSIAGIAAATAAVVVGAVLLSGGGSAHSPGLANSAPVTLTPTTPLSATELRQSATILTDRLKDLHVNSSSVTVAGGSLQASVPSWAIPLLTNTVRTRGVLRFRQVLLWQGAGDTLQGPPPFRYVTQAPTLSKNLRITWGTTLCAYHPNPNHGRDVARDFVFACDPDRTAGFKYILAPTAIANRQLKLATAGLDSTGQWVVNLGFNGIGSKAWKQLTAKAYNVNGGMPSVGQTLCSTPKGCNAVAITLDGQVVSAPYVEQKGGISGGTTQISGAFTKASAAALAAVLSEPPLPAAFTAATPPTAR